MHYFIDGYNLLFRMVGSSVGDLKAHRESLIQSLNVKVASCKLDVTIVFDSQYLEGEGSRSHYKHLEICYTSLGITADEYILEKLQFCQNPQNEIVITSDKDLAYKARNYNSATQTVEEFLGWLNKRYKNRIISPRKQPPPASTAKKAADADISPPSLEKSLAPLEGSLEYYHLQFEEKFKALKVTENLRKSPSKKKYKNKKIEPISEAVYLSEDERWLKIFQERFKNEQ